MVGTAWWWGRLGGEDGLMVGTAWWWGRLGGEDGLVVRTGLIDDEFRQRLKLFILSYLI
jgi:hypothetical protein